MIQYSYSMCLVTVAVILQYVLAPTLGDISFLFLYPVTIFCIFISRFEVGVFTTLISSLSAWCLFLTPRGSFLFKDRSDIAGLLTFSITGMIMSTLNEKMQKARQKEREALLARDEFLSIASHELKTPLTNLSLQNQLYLRRLKAGDSEIVGRDRLRKMLEENSKQIKRLYRLIDDMLDMTRLDSGRLSLQMEEFNLSDLVREVAELVDPQFKAIHSELRLRIDCELWGAWDRLRIEQVVMNILTNSLKYGGGRPVSLRVYRQDEFGMIAVQDQGAGIAPENHLRIFDRFERAVSDSGISGLGLGLYIARQLVSMHEGSIWVESATGQGSTFFIRLPLDCNRKEDFYRPTLLGRSAVEPSSTTLLST